jgi:hypothetical protein
VQRTKSITQELHDAIKALDSVVDANNGQDSPQNGTTPQAAHNTRMQRAYGAVPDAPEFQQLNASCDVQVPNNVRCLSQKI